MADLTFDRPLERWKNFLVYAIAQVQLFRRMFPGTMHLLIFWGFVIQGIGTLIALLQYPLFVPWVELQFPRGSAYLAYELIMDLAGLAILIGGGLAIWRRYFQKPETLQTRWDDTLALTLVMLIPLAGFTTEGLRFVATKPDWMLWSPIGSVFAGVLGLFISPEAAANAHGWLFWTHVGLGLIFLAAMPYTKLRHIINVPLNVLYKPFRESSGELMPIENIEEAPEEKLGAGDLSAFSAQQLLATEACMRCGRCLEVCPAFQSGQVLAPRDIVQDVFHGMYDTWLHADGKEPPDLHEDIVNVEAVWQCTTCGACTNICPAFINPIDYIIDFRRYRTLVLADMPSTVAETLTNLERRANPWGVAPSERMAWAKGLDVPIADPEKPVDVLLWIGCAGAFDDRNKKVTRALVQLLQTAMVDFAILGENEPCCGETARRLGNEWLFQEMVKANIELLSKYKFERLVTACPHGYNTFANEYPQFGGRYKVQHHTQLLAELIETGRIPLVGSVRAKVTYHDSCYLGRHNGIYEAPRKLVARLPGADAVEIEYNRQEAFCCGGGGGQMWMETDPETRPSIFRLNQALETQADVLCTACPYCMIMFEDAMRVKGVDETRLRVADIAELLLEALTVPVEVPESEAQPEPEAEAVSPTEATGPESEAQEEQAPETPPEPEEEAVSPTEATGPESEAQEEQAPEAPPEPAESTSPPETTGLESEAQEEQAEEPPPQSPSDEGDATE